MNEEENAVSPVVGVMLMLVVTIIIAAVVSAFAGSLSAPQQKAPQISAETTIANTGYYYGSQFTMVIHGVSDPIPSRDLRIVTSWKANNGVKNSTVVLPDSNNYHVGTGRYSVPFATGPGIENYGINGARTPDVQFGNYSLSSGTVLRVFPAGLWGPTQTASQGGYGPDTATYAYVSGTGYSYGTDIDGMQAVLGIDWFNLREGDIVNVKMIHTPSGKVILDQDVAVRGG
jgi:FlaG/FlaF family flagellin (archaellin)